MALGILCRDICNKAQSITDDDDFQRARELWSNAITIHNSVTWHQIPNTLHNSDMATMVLRYTRRWLQIDTVHELPAKLSTTFLFHV
jgi:hypothetical protein